MWEARSQVCARTSAEVLQRCPSQGSRPIKRTRAQVATATKAAIMADLGGEDRLSSLERIMVENAAMSAAVLRDAHVRWMQGEPVPVSELATLENTFNRTAAALGLSRRAKDAMTIDSYLDQKK
jgi:hypothetical protein